MIIIVANDCNKKNRPIRFKIKGLILIMLPEPRNDYSHTSATGVPRQLAGESNTGRRMLVLI